MPFQPGQSRNPQGRWKKGQSGNPGGRPRGLGILLRERYGEDGEKLVDAMDQLAFCEDVSPSNRFRMLAYLIDQHSGRPAQSMSVTGADGEPLL